MFGDTYYDPADPDGVRTARQSGENSLDIAQYWRLVLKHKLLLVGSILTAFVVGLAMTLLMTPIYTASTTLQIDREAARVFETEDSSGADAMIFGEEFFQTQYGILRSRSLAERVSDSLGLATSDAFLRQMGAEPPAAGPGLATRRKNAVVAVISDNLNVSPVRGSRLVTISFDSPDPALSARIANAFAQNFIQSNLDRKYEASQYAREFLEERIESTRARLEEAERASVLYAVNQQIINLSEGEAGSGATESLASNNLRALNDRLAQARAARVSAQEKWNQARSTDSSSLPEVLVNTTIQGLTERRAALESEYEQKSRLFQPGWPELVQLRAQIDELDRQINTVSGSVRNSLRYQYTVASNEERSLQAQVDALKGEVLDLRDRSVQYNILQREVDTSRTLYDGLLQRYKEVGITGGVTTNNISIVDEAQQPTAPSQPRMMVNLALALLVGLGFGVVAALLLEALDETLASPEDVESKLGVPVLGVIPLLAKGMSPKEALSDVRSPISEAYYSLRTALQFSTPDGAPRSLLVTSSRPSEGKSTTAYAAALSLARIGKRVLLIDGDLRNPSMHRAIGVENEIGMSSLLSDNAELEQVTHRTHQQGLDFVSCGPIPPNPAELWGGERARAVLDRVTSVYDHVIIDGPPVLGFADAPLLASAVAGTLFVVEAKGTRRGQARGALRRLSLGTSRVLGAVLTKFNAQATQYGSYNYAYDYEYGATAPARSGGKGRSAKP
jgi:capsular exopolysaccharide synthesis family protein